MRRTRHTLLTAIILMAGCATDDNRLGGQQVLEPDAGAGSGGAGGAGSGGDATAGTGGSSGADLGPPSDTYTVFADLLILPGPDEGARCMPRPLDVESDGTVACAIAQVRPASDCGCTAPGFKPASPGVVAAARTRMQAVELCGVDGRPACEAVCFCEMEQLTGAAGEACLSGAPLSSTGWCYIDPSQGAGSETEVEGCPNTEKRKIRFSQPAPPARPATVLACALHQTWPSLGPERDGAIGDSCTPSSEADPNFSNFSNSEVSVELGSRQCSSGVCLVNHFAGRATCPYGQVANDLTGCSLPGSGGSISVEVRPQDMQRREADAVYCSCRCAGPGPGPFCACSEGYTCAPLVDDHGLPRSSSIAGSYCIKQGTEWAGFPGPDCDRRLMNCP